MNEILAVNPRIGAEKNVAADGENRLVRGVKHVDGLTDSSIQKVLWTSDNEVLLARWRI